MSRQLAASNSDRTVQRENPMKGYKFNINDFSSGDIKQFKSVLKGNYTLKKRLKETISMQASERQRFYKKVRSKRLQRSSNALYERLFSVLHIPTSKSSEKVENSDIDSDASLQLDYGNWVPPATVASAGRQDFPRVNSLAGLPPGSEHLSGLDRLKLTFFPKRYAPAAFLHEEDCYLFNRRYLVQGTIACSIVTGCIMAVEHGRQALADFRKSSMSDFFASMSEGHRARHVAMQRTYIRYTYRWGWRAAFLFGTVGLISQSLCIYTLQDKCSHYVIAVGAAAALYKWKTGPVGMLASGLLSSCLVGLPLGFLCATLGQNPRPIFYDAYVAPSVMSPHHYLNWTDEQTRKNKVLVATLLQELKDPKLEEEVLQSELYNDLFPSNIDKTRPTASLMS